MSNFAFTLDLEFKNIATSQETQMKNLASLVRGLQEILDDDGSSAARIGENSAMGVVADRMQSFAASAQHIATQLKVNHQRHTVATHLRTAHARDAA